MSGSTDTHTVTAPPWPLTRTLFSPFAVLLYVYVAYFALTYSRIYEYVYWELMNLGTRIIGFHPSLETLGLYAWGAIVLALGFVAGSLLADRVQRSAEEPSASTRTSVAGSLGRAREALAGLPVVRRLGLGFTVSLIGWGVGIAANGAQIVASGTISLTDIASRWSQSPVLVLLAATQIFFVPSLIVTARGRWQRAFSAGAFVVSILALGLLGARNLPAKLVVSGFLAIVYVVKPKTVVRLAVVFLVLLVLAMGVIGSITKSGIYGPSATAGLAVALTYSDSVGTSYNLDRIVRMTPPTGIYGGRLLYDSVLALIPGVDAEYANFQLGRYLGGREGFVIGESNIERSVSLAPTLLGAPYADWGIPGTAVQMLLLGGLFGYLQNRARSALLLLPFLVTMASYVINGVNAGVHNPHAIVSIVLAALVVGLDMAVLARVPVVPSTDYEVSVA